jgi:hypothetical protein
MLMMMMMMMTGVDEPIEIAQHVQLVVTATAATTADAIAATSY